MKVTLQSTTRIVTVNGVPGRVWEGHTESGIAVAAVITRIAAPAGGNLEEFERDLQECTPPSPMAIAAIPLRLIL